MSIDQTLGRTLYWVLGTSVEEVISSSIDDLAAEMLQQEQGTLNAHTYKHTSFLGEHWSTQHSLLHLSKRRRDPAKGTSTSPRGFWSMQVEKSFDICLGLVAGEGWRGRFGTVQMEKACETPPALFWPGSARSLDGVRRNEQRWWCGFVNWIGKAGQRSMRLDQQIDGRAARS